VDYLSDVHQLELDAFPIPDVNEIGEKQDEEQMGRLLQLVLGIAIHCDGKEGLELCTLYSMPFIRHVAEYIRVIQSMEESVQHVVMAAIQHLLTSCMPHTPVGTSSKEVEELQDEVCCVKNNMLLYIYHELPGNVLLHNHTPLLSSSAVLYTYMHLYCSFSC